MNKPDLSLRLEGLYALRNSIGHLLQSSELEEVIIRTRNLNAWFISDNVIHSLKEWYTALHPANIDQWISQYPEIKEGVPKKIGIVMAGNIPLVGLHDLLSVWIAGHNASVKLSSSDSFLLPYLVNKAIESVPSLKDRVEWVNRLEKFDAVIATGNNNSARYFHYYFDKWPNIIRKNRNSLAVLDGNESDSDWLGLGKDIFTYFGLGCRNVSQIWIPEGFTKDKIFENIESQRDVQNHFKYYNNYEYQLSIHLLNKIDHKTNGFVILSDNNSIAAPIGVIHIQEYKDYSDFESFISEKREEIQCVVGNPENIKQAIAFGKSQSPALWDYADQVDTLRFLLDLK